MKIFFLVYLLLISKVSISQILIGEFQNSIADTTIAECWNRLTYSNLLLFSDSTFKKKISEIESSDESMFKGSWIINDDTLTLIYSDTITGVNYDFQCEKSGQDDGLLIHLSTKENIPLKGKIAINSSRHHKIDERGKFFLRRNFITN